jgi:hypothetical protein
VTEEDVELGGQPLGPVVGILSASANLLKEMTIGEISTDVVGGLLREA